MAPRESGIPASDVYIQLLQEALREGDKEGIAALREMYAQDEAARAKLVSGLSRKAGKVILGDGTVIPADLARDLCSGNQERPGSYGGKGRRS
jgi:hypothetical protein